MKWGKVLGKFLKGFVTGGIGAVVPQIPTLISSSGSADIKSGTVIALVVGLCNAFVNWYKHRED